MNKKTILVTGANGQLGNELRVKSEEFPAYNWIFTDMDELDIANEAAVEKFFAENKIDVCMNAAAYTNAENAEIETEPAFLGNAFAVKNLAVACEKSNAMFFHVSTDFIFGGTKSSPYNEDDEPNPLSVYGVTKLAGEKAAIENCSRAIVFRTSWVYSSFKKNFVKTMIQLGMTRPSVSVVFDQIGTPTYAKDLAACLVTVMEKNPQPSQFGIYHYSNEGAISWYDFTKSIYELKGIKTPVLPIESWEYPTRVKRPSYSVLNKKKIKETFGIEIPYWKNSLEECLKLL